jgi:hypothetical protein
LTIVSFTPEVLKIVMSGEAQSSDDFARTDPLGVVLVYKFRRLPIFAWVGYLLPDNTGRPAPLIQYFEANKGGGEPVYHMYGPPDIWYCACNPSYEYGGEWLTLRMGLSRPATVTVKQYHADGSPATFTFQWPGGGSLDPLGFGYTSRVSGRQTIEVTAFDGNVSETKSVTVRWVDDPNWLPSPGHTVTRTAQGATLSWHRTSREILKFWVTGAGLNKYLGPEQTRLSVTFPAGDPRGTTYRFMVEAITQYGWVDSATVSVTR